MLLVLFSVCEKFSISLSKENLQTMERKVPNFLQTILKDSIHNAPYLSLTLYLLVKVKLYKFLDVTHANLCNVSNNKIVAPSVGIKFKLIGHANN
jgi:hypothetical protein